MRITTTCCFCACAATVASLGPDSVWATGFDLPDQDAFVIGRGMAFVATADNPSAIYYNPAGISQLEGNNVRVGGYGLYLDAGYEPPAGGRSFSSDRHYHLLPQFYYTYTPKESDFSFGLGLYAPFGLSSRWPQDTGFRTVATEGKLQYYTINPVVAWKISESLALAGGVTANHAEADLRQGLVWPSQDFDLFKFKGDGWEVGYNLGLLWKVHDKVFLGATLRSATEVGMDGHTEYYNSVPLSYGPLNVPAFPSQTVGASADFQCPLKAILGVSYRPTPKWNLEFNADYTSWDQVNAIVVRQERGFGALVPQNVTLPLYWESSWYYEFGVTHYFEKGWLASFGYIYNRNSVPDAHYTPLVADLDRHFLSAGVGRRGERWDVDLAYQFGYGPDRAVVGSGFSPTGQTADGTYDFMSHAVALSVGFRF